MRPPVQSLLLIGSVHGALSGSAMTHVPCSKAAALGAADSVAWNAKSWSHSGTGASPI
jgi:hypothetical protein